eukprot:481322_1
MTLEAEKQRERSSAPCMKRISCINLKRVLRPDESSAFLKRISYIIYQNGEGQLDVIDDIKHKKRNELIDLNAKTKGNEKYLKQKQQNKAQILKQTLHYLTNKSPYISNPLHIKNQ